MPRVAATLEKLLDPAVLSPLLVVAGLIFLCGLNNILYTLAHNPREAPRIIPRIGPVPSRNLQSFSELAISLMGYLMIVGGCYILYTSGRYAHRRSALTYVLVAGMVLIALAALLLMSLYAQKVG